MTSGAPAERGAVVGARLLEVAGPELYLRNAFRVTGLATDATPRVVNQRRQQLTTALAVGAAVDMRGALPLPEPPAADRVRAALDALADPRSRLVHELFWFWDSPDAACSCAGSLHEHHDAAVYLHAHALDLELTSPPAATSSADKLWGDADRRWAAVAQRADFWDHVRDRVRVLDDPRLDETAVATLRDGFPRALVTPLVQLAAAAADPARLAAHAAEWHVPRPVVDEALAEATAPLLDAVTSTADEAGRQLDAGHPRTAGAELRRTALPTLGRLDTLALRGRHRRLAAVRDRVAVLLNNCGTALLDAPGSAPVAEIRCLLDAAHHLASSTELRRTIEENRALLDRQPIGTPGRRQSSESARAEVVALLRERVRRHYAHPGVAGSLDFRAALLDIRRDSTDPLVIAEIDNVLADTSGALPSDSPGWRPAAPKGRFPPSLIGIAVILGLVSFARVVEYGVDGVGPVAVVLGAVLLLFLARRVVSRVRHRWADHPSKPRRGRSE